MTMQISPSVLEKAIMFGLRKHKGQIRKGDGRPYILHPISVMTKVHEVKTSKKIYMLCAAAILHDTVEDCGVSLRKIAKKFGHEVASIVGELTLSKGMYMMMGKREYLTMVMNEMSSYALVIKLCDRLDNVSDLDTMDEDFRDRYVDETRYILLHLSRKLTKTHVALIEAINVYLNKYP